MSNRGFTLIEIAIVLVVIGLIISGGIAAFATIGVGSQRNTVEDKFDRIEEALTAYVIQNGCLPCPSLGTLASTSTEAGHARNTSGVYATACTSTACIVTNGVLPWLTLGLAEDEAADAWGNRIRYVVAGNPANALVCSGASTPVAGSLAQTNGMTRDASARCFPQGNLTVNASGTAQTSQAAYVLISTGPDGAFSFARGSGTAGADPFAQDGLGGSQDENTDDDTVFVEGPSVELSDVTHFDDIVRRKTAPNIITACGVNTAATCGNPA